MDPKSIADDLNSFKAFFDRSTACLDEEDSGFAPVEEMMTAAQQVAHVAQTVDWFFEGGLNDHAFGMLWIKHKESFANISFGNSFELTTRTRGI